MTTRREFLLSSGAIASAAALGAPQAWATPRSIAVLGKGIDGIINGFDPAEAYDQSADVLPNLYRTLMMYDPSKPGLLTGDLAENVDIAPNGLEFRFTIRKGLKFGSGAPVTAQDIAFSIQRAVKMNKAPSFMLSQLGLTAANVDTALRAQPDNTVTLVLPEVRASGLVLATLSTTVTGVVEQKVVMQQNVNGDLGNAWLRRHSAGSGPFRLVDWQPAAHIILEANANVAQPAKMRRLAIRHMAEPATELLQLRRGDLDVARTLGSDELRAIASDPSLTTIGTDSLSLIYVQMNMAIPMFRKREVLQAVKWAIDYDAIASHVTPGLWTSWQSFLPKGTPGALTAKPFRKDVAKARALLKAAGYANGFTVTLDHPNNWPYTDIAQALQANLADVGIRLELLAGDYGQVIAKRRARQHQMQIGKFGADHVDMSSFATYFLPNEDDSDQSKVKNAAWNNHFVDAKLTTAAMAGSRERDSGKRVAMYEQMQRDFLEVSPFAFILQRRDVAVVRKGVTGLAIGPIEAYTRYGGVQKS